MWQMNLFNVSTIRPLLNGHFYYLVEPVEVILAGMFYEVDQKSSPKTTKMESFLWEEVITKLVY
jgi:hypothetical protein